MPRLSVLKRAKIIHFCQQGMSDRLIAVKEKVDRRTVARWRKRSAESDVLQDLPRSGRPRITSAKTNEKMKKIAISKRTIPAFKIAQRVKTRHNTQPSASTVRRRLKDLGVVSTKAISKPLLTEKNKKIRLQFAKDNKLRDWNKVNFSDERTFYLEKNKGKFWTNKGERVTRCTVKHPPKVNIFASFGINGLGKMFLFEENLNAVLLKKF